MKKILILIIAGLSTSAYAVKTRVSPGITINNTVNGVVESGNWFNMKLQDDFTPQIGAQEYTAKIVAPIFDKTQTQVLIPANSIVKGKYVNDGNSCYFTADTINFKDTQIDLKSGAYTDIDAALPNLPECSANTSYFSGQLLIFQSKVAIPNLNIVQRMQPEHFKASADSYVQAVKTNDYSISNLTKYVNGFVQATIKINSDGLDVNKLVPIYYDDYGIPHNLNYVAIPVARDVYEYRMYSSSDNFGFGVME